VRQTGFQGSDARRLKALQARPDRLATATMNKGDAMAWIRIVLAAAVIVLPAAADAAELTLPRPHKVHTAKVRHARIAHVAGAHFGYYWGSWGSRRGGSANSWYSSTFVLAGSPWDGPGIVLKASPKSIVAIHCTERRPDACLGEPLVSPVAVAVPLAGR
jgi:hypothetical protein